MPAPDQATTPSGGIGCKPNEPWQIDVLFRQRNGDLASLILTWCPLELWRQTKATLGDGHVARQAADGMIAWKLNV